jgi:hypothetical protein
VGRRTDIFNRRRLRFFCFGRCRNKHRVGCVPCGFTASKRFDRDLRITIPCCGYEGPLIPSFIGTSPVYSTKVAAISGLWRLIRAGGAFIPPFMHFGGKVGVA